MAEERPREKEPEVFLKEIGCPFELGDDRCTHWLDGYKKGMNDGADLANAAFAEFHGLG